MIARLVVALVLLVAASSAAAADAPWQEGTHYFRIESAAPDPHPDQVDVVEVFSYGCPHCHDFDPFAEKIAAAMPEGAVFERLPAGLGHQSWQTFAHGWFAAKALGVADKAHVALFDAIYDQRSVSAANPTLEQLADFYAQYGVDAQTFVATAESFGVNAKVKRADDRIRSWGVTGTPNVVVDGKYRFSLASAGGYAQAVELAQWLTERELAATDKVSSR